MSKVLLLEDDRDMNMLLRTLLEIEGYKVCMFDIHKPAISQVEESRPDVILLDVHLGGQDGIQILRDIRRNPALQEVRIVMTSGINLTEDCLKNGANAFIVKPYMPDHLLELLKQVLAAPPGQTVSSDPPKPASPSTSFPKLF